MLALAHSTERLLWLFGIASAAGILGHFFIYSFLLNITRRTKAETDNIFVRKCYHSLQWTVVIIAIRLALKMPYFTDSLTTMTSTGQRLTTRLDFIQQILGILLIITVSWLLIRGISVFEEIILSRYDVGVKNNLKARKVHTQLKVIKRIATITVGIIALGTILMTFDRVRQLGTAILASAGVVGIVVGMAAQRTIATFIAGLQIAITQPIRVDDVVIVENEWGRIEEITLTYVVVRIWDLRRLIVPITYFIEKPFQNWTRVTADILGTVFVYVDHNVPVDSIREELQNILKKSEHWDGKVCVLQVTNTSERTVELRALMSAEDASKAWNLRCEVREKLVDFIRSQYPQSLPRLRAELFQTSQMSK